MSRNMRAEAAQYDPCGKDGKVFRPHSERVVSATRELNRLAERIKKLERIRLMYRSYVRGPATDPDVMEREALGGDLRGHLESEGLLQEEQKDGRD